MSSICVQFSDATASVIVSYFASPQDPSIYPNQQTLTTDDARWNTYYAAQTTEVQKGIPVPNS